MTRRRKIVLALATVVAVPALIGVGANVWVARASSDHIYSVADAPAAPVALVLGAGLQSNGTPTPFLAARLDVARQLYDRQTVKVILVSGDNRTHAYDEPTAMRDYLVAHGVPSERIVLDFAGRDTYDSCVRAHRIFGVDRLIAVSQGYHLPRAVSTCRAVGIDASGVGDDTMKKYGDVWASGAARERLAAVKTVVDLTTRRDPVLGPKEPGVANALAAADTPSPTG